MRWRVMSLEVGEWATHCSHHNWAVNSINNPSRQTDMLNDLAWGWNRGSLYSPDWPWFLHLPPSYSHLWVLEIHHRAHFTSSFTYRKPELFRSQISQKENVGLNMQRKLCRLKLYVYNWIFYLWFFMRLRSGARVGSLVLTSLALVLHRGSCQLNFSWQLSCRELISQQQLFQNNFYEKHKLLDDSLKV